MLISILLSLDIFFKLRAKDGEGSGKLIKRCVLSTACGQLVDSSIFITFGLFLYFLVFPLYTYCLPSIGLDILLVLNLILTINNVIFSILQVEKIEKL